MSQTNDVYQVKPLKKSEKLGFLTFSTANNIVFSFKSSYYLFFLTDVLKINVATAGLVVAIGTVWDAINDPMVGYMAVNHKFKNGEKCRPFALWAAVPLAITVVLLFTNFHLTSNAAALVALIIYLLFELMNTFIAIPYNSMASLATDRDSDRRSINVYRNLGGCFGTMIGALACFPLLKLFGAMDSSHNLIDATSSSGFFKTALVMGVIIIIGSLTHYFTTKERVKQIKDDESKLSFKTITKMLVKNRDFIMNTLYIMCYSVATSLMLTDVVYYAKVVLGSSGATTMIQAVYLLASIIASFLVSPIDKKLGRQKTMILGAIVLIVGKFWFLAQPTNVLAIYSVALTVGFGMTVAFVMFNTNRNTIVDLVEWKEGRRLDSMVSTVDNLAVKLMQALGLLGNSALLAVAGYNANLVSQPTSVNNMITVLIGWIPLVLAILMLIVCIYFPIEKDMKKMNEEKELALKANNK